MKVYNHALHVVFAVKDKIRKVIETKTIVSNIVRVMKPAPAYLSELPIEQNGLWAMLIGLAPNGNVNDANVDNQRNTKLKVAKGEWQKTPLTRRRKSAAFAGRANAPIHARARKAFTQSMSDLARDVT